MMEVEEDGTMEVEEDGMMEVEEDGMPVAVEPVVVEVVRRRRPRSRRSMKSPDSSGESTTGHRS